MLKNLNITPYWPQIKVSLIEGNFILRTKVRFNRDGVWYAAIVQDYSIIDGLNQVEDVLNRFTHACVNAQLFARVDSLVVDGHGAPVFTPDHIQISEEERLSKLLRP